MTVAFVLSGGASLGAVQVGMAQSLAEAGVKPDLIVGTSAGAINGAWLAGGRPLDELADVWLSLRRKSVFPLHPVLGLQAFLGRKPNFISSRGLERVLDANMTFKRIEDAPIHLTIMATDLLTGDEVALREGPTVPAILASAAIPAVFPPVEFDGRQLIDGGVSNNTPISIAIDEGATEVWVLSTGGSCALDEPPKGAVSVGMHAVSILIQKRFARETQSRDYPVPVRIAPHGCPMNIAPTDFSHTAELIETARKETATWLAAGATSPPYSEVWYR